MGNVSVIKENGREFSHTDSDVYLATISDKKWQNMHSSKAMIQLLELATIIAILCWFLTYYKDMESFNQNLEILHYS